MFPSVFKATKGRCDVSAEELVCLHWREGKCWWAASGWAPILGAAGQCVAHADSTRRSWWGRELGVMWGLGVGGLQSCAHLDDVDVSVGEVDVQQAWEWHPMAQHSCGTAAWLAQPCLPPSSCAPQPALCASVPWRWMRHQSFLTIQGRQEGSIEDLVDQRLQQ